MRKKKGGVQKIRADVTVIRVLGAKYLGEKKNLLPVPGSNPGPFSPYSSRYRLRY
jgi:hypothetical protein